MRTDDIIPDDDEDIVLEDENGARGAQDSERGHDPEGSMSLHCDLASGGKDGAEGRTENPLGGGASSSGLAPNEPRTAEMDVPAGAPDPPIVGSGSKFERLFPYDENGYLFGKPSPPPMEPRLHFPKKRE